MKGAENINRPVVVNGTRLQNQVPLYSTYEYCKKQQSICYLPPMWRRYKNQFTNTYRLSLIFFFTIRTRYRSFNYYFYQLLYGGIHYTAITTTVTSYTHRIWLLLFIGNVCKVTFKACECHTPVTHSMISSRIAFFLLLLIYLQCRQLRA